MPRLMIEHIQTTTATVTVVDISKIKANRYKSYDPKQKMMSYVKEMYKEEVESGRDNYQ